MARLEAKRKARDAKILARRRGRQRSPVLIVSAVIILGLGLVLAALDVWGLTDQRIPLGLALFTPVATAAGVLVVIGAFYLIVGLLIPMGAVTELTPEQKLVVRAAAAMAHADKELFHVEVEALRAWIERVYGQELTFDEVDRIVRENEGEAARKSIVTSVTDYHRRRQKWGPAEDDALISASVSVVISDLRNRNEELDYLKELAHAVEFDKARTERLVKVIETLEDQLEQLVVKKVLEQGTVVRDTVAAK